MNKYQRAEVPLKAWIYEAKYSTCDNANELKAKYGNASIISSKQVLGNTIGIIGEWE